MKCLKQLHNAITKTAGTTNSSCFFFSSGTFTCSSVGVGVGVGSSTPSAIDNSNIPVPRANPTYVNSKEAPESFDPASAVVYDSFISPSQGDVLIRDIMNIMKRKRFERGHWDAVITQYKEIELPQMHQLHGQPQQQRRTLSKESHEVIEKVRYHIEQTHFYSNSDSSSVKWLQPHAIYLKENGVLSAHVDSVKFSGSIVAGLSLLSPSIMRLKPASPSEIASSDGKGDGNDKSQDCSSKSLDNAGHVDLYLPPLSLYVLSGVSRFKYTHELLDSGESFVLDNDDNNNHHHQEEIKVHRKDRISVIFRDAKE